jgi:hypothetical protein
MSLSLAINGLLLITQTGFDFLTGLLDNIGVNSPVTMVSKEQKRLKRTNQDLKKKNSQLNKTITAHKNTIKKQKTAMKNYATHVNKKAKLRAARVASNGAAKTAATFIPAAANVVLGAAVLMDVVSLAEMCDDMIQFQKSVKDFDDILLFEETNLITGEVCATKVMEVSEREAKQYFGNLKKWSAETKDKFYQGIKTISTDVKDKLPDVLGKSVGGWIQLSDRYADYGACDLIGDKACGVLSKPIEAVCGLTNDKMWGCFTANNY